MTRSHTPPMFDEDRLVGTEFQRCYVRRIRDGFMEKYLSGGRILDIGYHSGERFVLPVTESAIGVGLDYPGYDGTTLPFADGSQDAILASHVLEHIPNHRAALAEWYRVLRPGGFMVLFVPHKYLYEKRPDIPSLLNPDHRRVYTSATLLADLEAALPINGFRIRHMVENDEGFNYDATFEAPPHQCYEIELVAEKIVRPPWSDDLEYTPLTRRLLDQFDRMIFEAVAASHRGQPAAAMYQTLTGSSPYFTPWHHLRAHFVEAGAPELDGHLITFGELVAAVRPLLECVRVDPALYVQLHPGLAAVDDPAAHWREHGYFEGRACRDLGLIVRDINEAARGRAPSAS